VHYALRAGGLSVSTEPKVVYASIAITMGRLVYDIEYDSRYVTARMLLWLVSAGAQCVWLGRMSAVTSHTARLAYTIAGSTGLFAIRDVFLLNFLLAPSLFVIYLFYLLRSVAEGGFLVSFYPCCPRFLTTAARPTHEILPCISALFLSVSVCIPLRPTEKREVC
jgi:hypothetical protein